MANYKYATFISQMNNPAFDELYHPGAIAPYSGIYRCHVCGHEAVSTKGNTLPPQTHHTHPTFAPIQWRLAVASTHV
jgi:hypothetical protein